MRTTARGQQTCAAVVPGILGEVLRVGHDGVGLSAKPIVGIGHTMKTQPGVCNIEGTHGWLQTSDKRPLCFWGQGLTL